LDTKSDNFYEMIDSIKDYNLKEDLFLQGKSVIYDDEIISKEYSVLEDPLGRKFLVTLDKNYKLQKVKQIQ
jgi:hypothetical protein